MAEISINQLPMSKASHSLPIYAHFKALKTNKILYYYHILELVVEVAFFMGRQNSDPNIAGPSIELLQERFRQLERAKLQRESGTIKSFSEPHVMTSAKNFVAVKPDVPHELIFLSRTSKSDQDQLFLGLSLNSKHTVVQVRKTQHSQ